ncbi:MAG TPA: hypothetical protein VF407_13595 [Polyangiaceae bacterium]
MIYRKKLRAPTRKLLQVALATGTLASMACYRVDNDNAPGEVPSHCYDDLGEPACDGLDSGPVGTAPDPHDGGPAGVVDAGVVPCVDDAGNPNCGISIDPEDGGDADTSDADASEDAGASDQ